MNAIIVTMNKFPNSDAGAVRELTFSRMLNSLGYNVYAFSMGTPTCRKMVPLEKRLIHMSLRGNSTSLFGRTLDYILFPLRMINSIKRIDFDVCIYTEIDLLSHALLKYLCKRKRATMVFDAVEWYSPDEFKNGSKSIMYKINDFYNTCAIKPPERVIAISKYLLSNYQKSGVRTIRIPVIMDTIEVSEAPFLEEKRKKTRIIYAGSPGNKDNLSSIILAIDKLSNEEKKKICFNIVGCGKEEIINTCPDIDNVIEKNKNVIFFWGRKSRKEVLSYYSESDFSIFVRDPKKRFASAGFPTKFVESLSCSTPVICNLSSDLEEFCMHLNNGIIIESDDVDSITEALRVALSLDDNTLNMMKKQAKESALQLFDYRNYLGVFKKFLS